jgi:hypothetical protein
VNKLSKCDFKFVGLGNVGLPLVSCGKSRAEVIANLNDLPTKISSIQIFNLEEGLCPFSEKCFDVTPARVLGKRY